MGCNFYLLNGSHVGKRSAAGLYCWDCGVTLCKRGESGVHQSDSEWFETCPKCGHAPVKETIEESAAGRELGFKKGKPARKKGVASCASFTWAMWKDGLAGKRVLEDEYGKRYTRSEFDEVLLECPIQYGDMIGREFC